MLKRNINKSTFQRRWNRMTKIPDKLLAQTPVIQQLQTMTEHNNETSTWDLRITANKIDACFCLPTSMNVFLLIWNVYETHAFTCDEKIYFKRQHVAINKPTNFLSTEKKTNLLSSFSLKCFEQDGQIWSSCSSEINLKKKQIKQTTLLFISGRRHNHSIMNGL